MPTNVCLVKAMVFPVVMYGCESWTLKKAECRRIDAFELWCWRRLLRVPWTSRRPNQSILKEISPEYSLEGLMLNLKLQYFGHLLRRTDSLEKTLMLGKIEGKRRRGNRGWDGWMTSLTQWTWVWVISRSWWWTGRPGVLQSTESQRVGHDWATELNWMSPGNRTGAKSWVSRFLFLICCQSATWLRMPYQPLMGCQFFLLWAKWKLFFEPLHCLWALSPPNPITAREPNRCQVLPLGHFS